MEQQSPESRNVKSAKKCPECQEVVSPTDKFCRECGRKLLTETAPQNRLDNNNCSQLHNGNQKKNKPTQKDVDKKKTGEVDDSKKQKKDAAARKDVSSNARKQGSDNTDKGSVESKEGQTVNEDNTCKDNHRVNNATVDKQVDGNNSGGQAGNDVAKKNNEDQKGPEMDKGDKANAAQETTSDGKHDISASSGRQRSQYSRDHNIPVVFHVVVSPDFKFKHNADTVCIMFEPKSLGGLKRKHEMAIVRSMNEGYHLAEVEILIPYSLLKNNQKTSYKYSILSNNKNEILEDIPKHTRHDHTNRLFGISTQCLDKINKWHQYDGIMLKKPEGTGFERWWKKHVSGYYYNKYIEQTLTAVKLMLPDVQSYVKEVPQSFSTNQFIQTVFQVHKCVNNRFMAEDPADATEKMQLDKTILEYITSGIKMIRDIGDAEMKLGLALALVNLFQNFKYYSMNPWADLPREDIAELCKALLLKEDLKGFTDLMDDLADWKRDIERQLQMFIVHLLNMKETLWVLIIPLYHFISCQSYPGEPLKYSEEHTSETWWGTKNIDKALLYNSGGFHFQKRDIEEIMVHLAPLFSKDPLLNRTLMAAITSNHLPDEYISAFSPEAVLANIYFDLHSHTCNTTRIPVLMRGIQHRLEEDLKNIADDKKELLFQASCVQKKVTLDVLKVLLHHVKSTSSQEVYHSVMMVFSNIIRNMCMTGNKQELKDLSSAVSELRKTVTQWIEKIGIDRQDLVTGLVVFSELLQISFGVKEVDSMWQDEITALLYNKHMDLELQDWLKYYNERPMHEYHPVINEFCTKEALRATETTCKNKTDLVKEYRMSTPSMSKMKSWLSHVFNQILPNNYTDKDLLDKILQEPAFITYINLYCQQQGCSNVDLLEDHIKQCIEDALSVFNEMTQKIINSRVSVKKFKWLAKHKNVMLEVQNILDRVNGASHGRDCNRNILANAFNWHEMLLKEFFKQKESVRLIVEMCQDLSIDVSALKIQLEKEVDIQLIALCQQSFSQESTSEQTPHLTYFQIDSNVLQCADGLRTFAVSATFQQIFQERKEQTHLASEQIQDIIDQIWQPAKAEFKDLFNGLKSGHVLLHKVKKYFEPYTKENLKKELGNICQALQEPSNTLDVCLKQIEQYLLYCQYSSGTTVLQKLVDKLGLTGNYDKLNDITSMCDGPAEQLNSFSPERMETVQSLVGIDSKKEECLNAFLCCQSLVEWLKSSLAGINQVKVLVDLAMITAHGQGDIEVKKVKCLHAAATGYASLIYELEKDADFDRLLELCKSVWRCLESDPSLPQKLRATQNNLEWLKKVKESKGSVELNAFAQVELINSEGIYIVGNIDPANTKTSEDNFELVIPSKPGKREKREKYTQQQLIDLQSRLMLVAGKAVEGKAEVDRFVEILDGVMRMSSLYFKLSSAGCIIFKNWKATLYCKPDRPINVQIEFGLSDRVMSGDHCEGDVLHHITIISEFLECCHTEWNKHKLDMREQYPVLNYFTTEQLVMLCKDLVSLYQADRKVPNSVYHLIHPVNKYCTLDLLKEAVDSAVGLKEAVSETSSTNELEIISTSTDVEFEEEFEDIKEKNKTFIAELTESGYSEKLALEALQHFGPDQLQDAVAWCMTRDEELSEGTEDMNEGTNKPEDFELDKTIQQFTSELFQRVELQESSLGQKLKQLWQNYIGATSTSLSEFLSIEHLGHTLTYLQESEQINRPFPEYLKVGLPNLLICPQGLILQVILSLYAHVDGRNKPLPQRDEVLLCSGDTTTEQVELLVRRAAFDKSGRLYCLADVGQLNYEVAEKSEVFFEEYCSDDSEMHLVVICTQETEYNAHVANCLERYKVPYPSLYDLSDIQNYLKDHFTNKHENAASVVDPDSCIVRVVKSHRAGVGKTLCIHRIHERLQDMQADRNEETNSLCIVLPIHRRQVNISAIMDRLSLFTLDPSQHIPRIFHIDLAHEVVEGVDCFLFNLLILGSIMDKQGTVWQRSDDDLYVVETMPLLHNEITAQGNDEVTVYVHQVLHLLPSLTCWSPVDSLLILNNDKTAMLNQHPNWKEDGNDQMIDRKIFSSESLQRPYQYLKRYSNGMLSSAVNPRTPEDEPVTCLNILMRYCGIQDPSWAELNHFVQFLNVQLCDYEHSDFCLVTEQDLPGFKTFVIKFMISMSRDFATRSLNISEETPGMRPKTDTDDLFQYLLKRRWENSPHAYVFFNADPRSEYRHSMTFLGFTVNHQGDIIDSKTKQVQDHKVIPSQLQQGLKLNHVPLNENFDCLPRDQKIYRLCMVMGIDLPHDPDPTYELTTDNVQKILAIHMRFRCMIPVVVMGETGCGKTRLVKFMCDLQKPPGANIQNLILMKVHGGTTEEQIKHKVEKSLQTARENKTVFRDVDTVLFFDEANTSDAIGLLKEILCDQTMMGQPLKNENALKFVVACNPYRKHSDEVIHKLEQAGLGYHVKAEETKDKLGTIPMRQLVYRVHALPQSILPLVWDFGQLATDVEQLYIKQMVQRYVKNGELTADGNIVEAVSSVLASSQEFMKHQEDECSFVSLRDIDRVLKVMAWVYKQKDCLFPLMDDKYINNANDDETEEIKVNDITRMLILALGVCYHASIHNREEYRNFISQKFTPPLSLPRGSQTIADEINNCQEVFIDQIQLENNIARNQALKENLFMMIVCIELRIPLFLVGKPGSSKSLAKTIVDNVMQGDAAHCELFRNLKQVHMISFQCSPLSTPEGIVTTFQQCAQLQHEKDLDRYVAAVVLDEVGLAEDSPLMPLKSLHPLLEDGCVEDEKPDPYKKVACVAISNWALDPAKMNRGIHVHRGVPDIEELKHSAKGICSTNPVVCHLIEHNIGPLAEGYLRVCEKAIQQKREFFGLRDFYSLVKMVYGFAERSGKKPIWRQVKHAILRNFGGLEHFDPVAEFQAVMDGPETYTEADDPHCSPAAMVKANIKGDGLTTESRYLLILTENYAALSILQQELLDNDRTTVIFGSSFPKDQEYTQVCRNINRIKICMETGCTIVLLNLDNLYESLYDALNQYYVRLGDSRFVDLGLGTQRVKCEVHKDFKLVLVAEKHTVYNRFPIPLINRLEKHLLTMSTVLTRKQKVIVERLKEWVIKFHSFTKQRSNSKPVTTQDVFIGYHADTCATVVMYVSKMHDQEQCDEMWKSEVLERSQDLLLQCATPDAVLRLKDSHLAELADAYADRYYNHQKHGSLLELLEHQISRKYHTDGGILLQVTTHSKLLSSAEILEIGAKLGFSDRNIKFVSIHAFETEHQFSKMLRTCLSNAAQSDQACLLLIQCESGDRCGSLIACARYIILDELAQNGRARPIIHIVLLIQLSLTGRGIFFGFQGGHWICYHIDDLHDDQKVLPPILTLSKTSLSLLFEAALKQKNLKGMKRSRSFERYLPSLHTSIDNNNDTPTDSESDSSDIQRISYQLEKMKISDVESNSDCDSAAVGYLDIDSLVNSCIQKAASMLRDHEADSLRKVKRVSTLLRLLQPEQGDVNGELGVSFLDAVNIKIHCLLKDKEKATMVVNDNWLHVEVASLRSVKKAGNFRHALEDCIQSKITVLLAGIIAYADKNRNLDLLVETNEDNWLHTFWIKMFLDPNITSLTYSDLQTLTTSPQRRELTEFFVETSACNKLPFSGKLPFSWIIYGYVNSLVYQSSSRTAKDDIEILVYSMMKMSPVGCILNWIHEIGYENNMIERYQYDFVHMVYVPRSNDPEAEIELITKCIRCAFREHNTTRPSQAQDANQKDEEYCDTPIMTIPAIHLSFNRIQKRIHLFGECLHVWPEAIFKFCADDNTPVQDLLELENEMTLDVAMLYLVLQELQIGKDFDGEKMYKATRGNWLQKVERFRPVIERILNNTEDMINHGKCGPYSKEFYDKCRHLWTTVLTVYLFVQHVCPPEMPSKTSRLYKCLPLWKMLGEAADFKTEKSMTAVEKFIRTCNILAKSIYYKKKNCNHCGEILDSPVQLPCKHSICSRCADELKDMNSRICPECKEPFPNDLELKPPAYVKEETEEHNQYKRRCNAFFMDLVSSLCFSGTAPPEKPVIRKLMDYVICERKVTVGGRQTRRTGHMAVLQGSIDPTPVVRSFLLQFLLRLDIDQVRDCLTDYFDSHADLLIDPQQIMEFSLLCVFCLEDHFYNYANMHTTRERVDYICYLLEANIQSLTSESLSFCKLEAIAGVRFALAEVATLLHSKIVDNNMTGISQQSFQRLCNATEQLCLLDSTKELGKPSSYLMKQIFSQYGQSALQTISQQQNLEWVIPEPARDNQNVRPDVFVALGEEYTDIRELVAEVLLGKDAQELVVLLQKQHNPPVVKERNILLSLYREITTGLIKPEALRPNAKIITQIGKVFNNHYKLLQQDLLGRILTNQLSGQCHHMTITEKQEDEQTMLTELLLHWWIVMNNVKRDTLLGPLWMLTNQPQKLMDAYLPTMPEDHFEEVRAVLLKHRGKTYAEDSSLTFWKCPNGHPYIIGNCGRPIETDAQCPECAEPIGGVGYNIPASKNSIHQNMERHTACGHILGKPHQRPSFPVPERLNPLVTSILRIMVHMSMYLGANRNCQDICQLVHPKISPDSLAEFLWQHLCLDFKVIGKALGRNMNDSALFIHLLLNKMLANQCTTHRTKQYVLKTVQERKQWEVKYSQCFITPVLKSFKQLLSDANQKLATDKRLGNNVLLRVLYEVDQHTDDEIDLDNIQEERVMWSLRSRITIEQLIQAFQRTTEQKCNEPWNITNNKHYRELLELFLQEEHHLRLLRHLPNILQLQQTLSQKIHLNMERSEAMKMTIRMFIREYIEDHLQEEFEGMVKGFADAWYQLRGELGTFAVRGSTVPAEYCEQVIDDQTVLAMLLPNVRGQGLCALALVHYIIQIHNNFIENYSRISKQSLPRPVSSHNITQAHIVSYDVERDLMPLILANCNYTLIAGQGISIDYDFKRLSQQIEERFIRGRPRIIPEVSEIVYREEYTDASIFAQLQTKIPQEPVDVLLQQQICKELRHLTEFNQSLTVLDIVIRFLTTTGGDKDMGLHDFVTVGLKMSCNGLGKATQKCNLCHVQSLWLLLAHERAKLLSAAEQDAFDMISPTYHEELDKGAKECMLAYLKRLYQLDTMLPQLFECIMLYVGMKVEDPNREDFVQNRNYPLGDVLASYLSSRDYEEIPSLSDGSFPKGVQLKHCICVWKLAFQASCER